MRRFLKIFNRLIPIQSEKQTTELHNSETQLSSSCAKTKKSFRNASRRRGKWYWSRNQRTSSTPCRRSIIHAAPSFHRDYADATLQQSVAVEGTRRAPVLGNIQPPRSSLPPFEESIRTSTRRTPGSEDATSVETEVGYPVVGPVTPRIGHQNLRSTLFHQNEVTFSQDVSTNTTYNIPLIRTFSAGPPSTHETDVQENTGMVSTESQTTQAEAPPIMWLPEMPTSGSTEQQDIPELIPNPQEDQLTTTQPPANTSTSPFRPVAQAEQPSTTPNPQAGHLPKNFHFPSQMRRNRSNTEDSNSPGHRKIVSACSDFDIKDPFFSKTGRSYPRGGRLGSPGRRDSAIWSEEPQPDKVQISTSMAQEKSQNANDCAAWTNIQDNRSAIQSKEKNFQDQLPPGLGIQPGTDIKSSENIGIHRDMLEPFRKTVGLMDETNAFGRCLKLALDSPPPTYSPVGTATKTIGSQTSIFEKYALKMDRGTQSFPQADLPGHNAAPDTHSSPLATSVSSNVNVRLDSSHPSVTAHRNPIFEDEHCAKLCIQLEAEAMHISQENSVQSKPINQASTLYLSTMLPSRSIGSPPNDQPTREVSDLLEKQENAFGAGESLTSPMPPIVEVTYPHGSGKMSETTPTNMPVLLITVPERESKASADEKDSVRSIDVRNHLFVKNASEVSVASSVYIGEDGKAAVTRNLDLDMSSSRGTPDGTHSQRQELGAKPKIREPLSLRKKMLAINDDSLVKDRSSAIDDGRNLVARGHRVIGDRIRGWTRNQISSRKSNYGDPRRSPGRCPRGMDSKRTFETTKRFSGQPAGELRSIWINPQTERSFPNSNSTLYIPAGISQTILLSNPSKPPSKPASRPSSRTPTRVAGIGADANKFMVECVSCKARLEAPIRQCIEGHGFCAKCSSLGDCCPVCRSLAPESDKIRDFIRNIRFPCKNSLAGCRETYGAEDSAKLEPRCLYRQRACPLANGNMNKCAWKGVRSGIRGHMKKHHGHSGTIHPFRTFFPVETFDSKLWADRAYGVEILFVENEIFELHKVFDTDKSCVWGLLRRIVAKDIMQRYNYNIRFQPKNIRSSLTFNIEALEGSEELNKAFDLGKRFKFYFDSLSQEPLEVFSIHLRVVPRSTTTFHNVL